MIVKMDTFALRELLFHLNVLLATIVNLLLLSLYLVLLAHTIQILSKQHSDNAMNVIQDITVTRKALLRRTYINAMQAIIA